ncbi:MAG: hypothetical protein LBE18_01310 [Planctomycetaceae bacterium]|nr:hypothetical protein [Planctomycetaceae bacterium]
MTNFFSGNNDIISVRFDGVPLSQAVTTISQLTGFSIVYSASLESNLVHGYFDSVSVSEVLNVVARRVGSQLSLLGNVYYIGELKKEDRLFAVLRIPPVDRGELLTSLRASCSNDGAVNIVGSCLFLCDNVESLKKMLVSVETIRNFSSRCYIAEVFFIRVNEDDFLRLTADLEIQQIDILSSAFDVNQLFKMFVDADGSVGFSKIVYRPILFLSEGREVVFSDGREITKEQKGLSDYGVQSTVGYQKFSDGIILKLLLNRVSNDFYSVDFDFSVSTFDKSDITSTVPASDKSSLVSKGLLLQDSSVYYVGSLKRDVLGNKNGFFSFSVNKSHDMLTVWVRVRELRNSRTNIN